MRYVTYQTGGGGARVGRLDGDTVVDTGFAGDMIAFIEAGAPTGQGIASSHWHQGAAAAAVEVDDETGVLTLRTVHAASYAGRVVNRAAAELQQEGAMIMAIGTSLFEELTFDQGQVAGPNLSDYNIPSALDCAAVTQTLLEVEGAEIHGLGETALPPVPPAIGNALASLGYRPTRLPLTPERVLDCVEDAS